MRFVIYNPKAIAKRISVVISALLLLLIISFTVDIPTISPAVGSNSINKSTIGIDAGHGGYDAGANIDGVLEKDINLNIALKLEEVLLANGYNVVMTRREDKDFLQEVSGPKKKQDFANRKKILTAQPVDIIVSIHVNSFPSSKWSGAQVFYDRENPEGKKLAQSIQDSIIETLQNTNRDIATQDHFITREFEQPSVIVETGFISNPQERKNLEDPNYQYKLVWAIYSGIMNYQKSLK
ncbi:N-acetylmuramoyl-L-alanine amidase [Proteinivorax hydrogeniformans]|uniref:N-acetylmuramoyl-L-alanine amidase n=1 Tax=Proteinivorax hydrogeniformans TaxID=1826727 RepID=A0AAU8HU70_9FIRM